MRHYAVFCVFAAILASGAARADDWPQYLGPDRNSIVSDAGIAREWPAGGPKVLWSVALGEGFGSPAIADGQVYILDRVNNQKDVLRCLDLATGAEQWTFENMAPGRFAFNGSRNPPAVDGERVFAVGPMGHFYCVDRSSHALVWSKNILEEYGGSRPNWAVAQSPLLYKESVIVAPQSPKALLAAFDRETGETRWVLPMGAEKGGYVSPMLATIGGVDQILMATANDKRDASFQGRVVGVEAATGKLLWEYLGWQCQIPIAPPTAIGDGRIFITGGYDAGSAMIKVTAEGGAFKVEELFTTRECNSQTHPPIIADGYLYVNSNSNSARDGMICMSLDGKLMWKTQSNPWFERGGHIMIDGLIVNQEGDKGNLRLIEPSPEGYKEIAQAHYLESKQAWAPQAFSEGKLIIRDQKTMMCLDLVNP